MAAIDDLKNLLSLDIRQLETLAETLHKEKSCLSGSDTKTLDTLTRKERGSRGDSWARQTENPRASGHGFSAGKWRPLPLYSQRWP